jgi:hypothetical protein
LSFAAQQGLRAVVPRLATLALAILAAFAAPPLATAQPADAPPSEAQAPSEAPKPSEAQPSEAQPSEAQPSEAQPSASELFRRTLGVDIDTASYFELVAWALDLGLEDSGGRRELQERLRLHFELADDAIPTATPGRAIKIESAELAEYFTLEEIDETYVRLRGGVVVSVDDREAGARHFITADEVVYNQQTDSLTARGEVEYRLESAGTEEIFRGESLTFEVATTEATFLRGSTQREHSTGTETVTFRFAGERIVRLADDTVVLDDGRITSSPRPDEPNYEIRARQMWILAPNEWAMRGATLYVGRIPVLAIPFFFRGGDELFFHPSIKVEDERGAVVNTTTYLVGRRIQPETPFSVLRTSDDAQYEERVEGLFLRKVPGTGNAVGATGEGTGDGRFLKLMVDLYARVGAFVGVEGLLPGPAGATQLTVRGGLAVSRSVRFVPPVGSTPGFYTPYLTDTSGNLFSLWHTVDWLGAAIPLRYALDVDFSSSEAPGLTLTAGLKWFSDPRFPADFYNREERIDWPALVGLPGDPVPPVSERSTLTWEADAPIDLPLPTKVAGTQGSLDRLSISRLNTRLFWQSRTDAAVYCAEVADLFGDQPICDAANFGGALANLDPTREFYYPSTLRLPLLSVAVAGTLLELPIGTAATTEPSDEPERVSVPGRGLRGLPDASSETPTADPETGPVVASARPPRAPKPRGDLPVATLVEPFTASLRYDVKPSVTVEETFDSEPWDTPAAVDFSPLYVSTQLTEQASLVGKMSLYGGLLDLRTTLSNSSTYQTRFARGTSLRDEGAVDDAAWDALLQADLTQTGTSFSSANTVTLAPLLGSQLLAASTITYNLDLDLYEVAFDAAATSDLADPVFVVVGPQWTEAGINRHALAARLALLTGEHSQSLTLAASLPPPAGEFDLAATLSLASAFATGSVAASVAFDPKGAPDPPPGCQPAPDPSCPWQFDLLRAGVTLTFGEMLSFRQELDTNVQLPALDRSASTLTYGDLNATVVARYMVPLDPSGVLLGVERNEELGVEGDEELLFQQLSFAYTFASEPILLWRNRIQMDIGFTPAWSINLQDFINNAFTFDLSFEFKIHEFLDLALTTKSSNDRTYRYLPGLPQKVGEAWVNPLQDLWWSFQFWNPQHRQASAFNLRDLSLRLVHSLEDWNLTFEYGGTFEPNSAATFLEWTPNFSLMVQWIPVPEISSELTGGDTFSIGS